MDSKVVFFQVQDNGSKLAKVVEIAQMHFESKEKLLILTDDDKGAQFVDDLLWKSPAASFLPHGLYDAPTEDYIAITSLKKNINTAHLAFNLCATPLMVEGPFRIIYEFEDLSTPVKKNFAALKLDAYRKMGYLIEAAAPSKRIS